jgi:HEAT repeat protein
MKDHRLSFRIPLAAILVTLAGAEAATRAQQPPAEELLDLVRSDVPPPRSAAKRDGSRPTTSAARFVETKDLFEAPSSPAKRNVVRAFRQPAPDWLRRTSPAGEEAALRHVPAVGFFPLPDDELRAAYLISFRGSVSEAFVSPDLQGLPHTRAAPLAKRWVKDLTSTAAAARNLVERDSHGEFENLLPAPGRKRDQPDLLREATIDILRPDSIQTRKAGKAEPSERSSELALSGLVEVLSTQPAKFRIAFVRSLQKLPEGDPAAISVLVRFALFDVDRDVRAAAVRALQREPVRIYGPKLLEGFRYPWPIVAERAADALIALDRKELLPNLANLLDEPDPAAPIEVVRNGWKVRAVRELVKLNHHANCLVCHAPFVGSDLGDQKGLIARLPSSERELPPESSVDEKLAVKKAWPLVRADITNLRHDFSALREVDGSAPWPKMQRYDYVVRVRAMLPPSTVRKRIDPVDEEIPSAHRRAVLYALSRLTSTYVGTLARDWRLLIEQPNAPPVPETGARR